jgi:hypothetical protein
LALKVQLLPPLIVAVLRAMGYNCKGRPFAWVLNEAAVAASVTGTAAATAAAGAAAAGPQPHRDWQLARWNLVGVSELKLVRPAAQQHGAGKVIIIIIIIIIIKLPN